MHLGYLTRLFDFATFVVGVEVLDRTTRSRSLGAGSPWFGWKDVTAASPEQPRLQSREKRHRG